MLMMIHGYPPAIIRKRDRLKYIQSLEKAQLGGSNADYLRLITAAVDRSLDIDLKAAQGEDAAPAADDFKLLKIGELARKTHLPNSTIRHWTKEGLLDVAETTESGYQLYAVAMLACVERIQQLQGQRFTLQEIGEKLRRSEN